MSRRRRQDADHDHPAPGDDAKYLTILLSPLRSCASYKPKFGRGASPGLDLDDFRALYGADPFYAWFGLDNPLIYTAHRAAGGMTSIYRQIGIGCERLFRRILQGRLRLSDEDTAWSHAVADPDGGSRTLSLDGRIPLKSVADDAGRRRVREWIDPDVASRYEAAKWVLLRGQVGVASSLVSTYSFARDVLGYNLAAFFERNQETLRTELASILETLLTTEQP